MSVIDRLFLPLRGKINLRTDVPDGIELGGNEDEEKDTNCCSYSAYYIESLILFWT